MAEATSVKACIERHVAYPYDVWATEMNGTQRSRLERMYGLLTTWSTVLDVGCNSGYAVHFRPDCIWTGVDVSPELVAKARQNLDGAQVAAAEELPFADGTFDHVVLGEILEHVYDPGQVLSEAARVARLSIVGSTPDEAGAWGKHTVAKHRFHVRAFSEVELRALLSEYGRASVNLSGHFLFFKVAL